MIVIFSDITAIISSSSALRLRRASSLLGSSSDGSREADPALSSLTSTSLLKGDGVSRRSLFLRCYNFSDRSCLGLTHANIDGTTCFFNRFFPANVFSISSGLKCSEHTSVETFCICIQREQTMTNRSKQFKVFTLASNGLNEVTKLQLTETLINSMEPINDNETCTFCIKLLSLGMTVMTVRKCELYFHDKYLEKWTFVTSNVVVSLCLFLRPSLLQCGTQQWFKQRFKRSLYKSAVRSVHRPKVECIDQAQTLCQMHVDFSYILVVFSYIDKFLSFGFI